MLAPTKCAQMLIRDDGEALFNVIFAVSFAIYSLGSSELTHFKSSRDSIIIIISDVWALRPESEPFLMRATSHLWRIEKFSFGAANQNYGTQIVESPRHKMKIFQWLQMALFSSLACSSVCGVLRFYRSLVVHPATWPTSASVINAIRLLHFSRPFSGGPEWLQWWKLLRIAALLKWQKYSINAGGERRARES